MPSTWNKLVPFETPISAGDLNRLAAQVSKLMKVRAAPPLYSRWGADGLTIGLRKEFVTGRGFPAKIDEVEVLRMEVDGTPIAWLYAFTEQQWTGANLINKPSGITSKVGTNAFAKPAIHGAEILNDTDLGGEVRDYGIDFELEPLASSTMEIQPVRVGSLVTMFELPASSTVESPAVSPPPPQIGGAGTPPRFYFSVGCVLSGECEPSMPLRGQTASGSRRQSVGISFLGPGMAMSADGLLALMLGQGLTTTSDRRVAPDRRIEPLVSQPERLIVDLGAGLEYTGNKIAERRRYLDAYDAAGGTKITRSWATVPLGTVATNTAASTLKLEDDELTIFADGELDITYRDLLQSVGVGQWQAEDVLEVDTGSGYAAVPGSLVAFGSEP